MNSKLLIFVLFCVFHWLTTEVTAQTASCDYSFRNNWHIGYKTRNATYYSCLLNTRQTNYNEKLTRIDGQHTSGHSDADVKWIRKYRNHKLRTLSSIFCQKYPNLKAIDMDNAELELIDEDSLMNCQDLDRLFLHANKIREIPEKLLSRNLKLTAFGIGSNPLTTLPENFFQNQNKLEDFFLEKNQINFLPDNIFRSLVNLEVMYLNNNKLQSINPKWFINLNNLKWLGLNGNQISEIQPEAFAVLKNLEKLWIFENRIKALNSESFDGLQNLQALILSSNEITDLPVGVFTKLRNLQELSLRNNKLTKIHSDSFGTHNQLTIVELQDNKINEIDPKFIDKTAVSTINMRNNVCSQLDTKTKSEIKPNLNNCFNNYQPRIQHQAQCGKSKAGRGNIVGGTQINRGDYPWIAALMTPKGKFFCGGTLVSSRKVVSAAHCIQEKKSPNRLTASNLIVLFGSHDLDNPIEIGRTYHAVQNINVHPDWNTLTQAYDADIAVLVLEKDVTFNEHVQPICLPIFNSNIETITSGSVVGYGKSEDETKDHENIPKILTTPIHNNNKCFADNEDLILLSSGRTFCGGTGKGIGVCLGDSGSGLIVFDRTTFYLRGVVSSSLFGGPFGCDVNVYAIFTDVLKFIDWINGIATDRFSVNRKK